jgi:hypothetical protein
MTHAELVEIAYRWLLKAQGCQFAFKELVTAGYEIPDAIGFRGGGTSILVECKASRADFLGDKKKPHRVNPGMGMGTYRYYLCPTGMIKADELPPGWGLVYVGAQGAARQVHGPKGNCYYERDNPFRFNDKDQRAEIKMMMSALRRLHLREMLPLIYEGPVTVEDEKTIERGSHEKSSD